MLSCSRGVVLHLHFVQLNWVSHKPNSNQRLDVLLPFFFSFPSSSLSKAFCCNFRRELKVADLHHICMPPRWSLPPSLSLSLIQGRGGPPSVWGHGPPSLSIWKSTTLWDLRFGGLLMCSWRSGERLDLREGRLRAHQRERDQSSERFVCRENIAGYWV